MEYYYIYMWRWQKGETPIGWVSFTPIKIFGIYLGSKIKMRYREDISVEELNNINNNKE